MALSSLRSRRYQASHRLRTHQGCFVRNSPAPTRPPASASTRARGPDGRMAPGYVQNGVMVITGMNNDPFKLWKTWDQVMMGVKRVYVDEYPAISIQNPSPSIVISQPFRVFSEYPDYDFRYDMSNITDYRTISPFITDDQFDLFSSVTIEYHAGSDHIAWRELVSSLASFWSTNQPVDSIKLNVVGTDANTVKKALSLLDELVQMGTVDEVSFEGIPSAYKPKMQSIQKRMQHPVKTWNKSDNYKS